VHSIDCYKEEPTPAFLMSEPIDVDDRVLRRRSFGNIVVRDAVRESRVSRPHVVVHYVGIEDSFSLSLVSRSDLHLGQDEGCIPSLGLPMPKVVFLFTFPHVHTPSTVVFCDDLANLLHKKINIAFPIFMKRNVNRF